MDYKTKPASRRELRMYADEFRKQLSVREDQPFPVLHALEMIPFLFENCNYTVLKDHEFPPSVMARTLFWKSGGFTIELRESVYSGAFHEGNGAYRNHICHEIAHVILFSKGYLPLSEESFHNNELQAFESVEWQAKALAGELMMPYDATKDMTAEGIVKAFGVSIASAIHRLKY